jgi:hypothetical protein
VTVLRARDLSAWRAAKGEPDAPSLLAAGREAWSRKDGAAAARHLEAALDAGLHGRDWWAAARLLADVYLAAERRDDARYVLEELVERPSADPFPFLALADLVEAEDAPRARTLRARARAIAPWC